MSITGDADGYLVPKTKERKILKAWRDSHVLNGVLSGRRYSIPCCISGVPFL